MAKNRNTIQKKIIQSELDKMKTFFTAESLYEKIKQKESNVKEENSISKNNSKVSLATIYRYLNDLKSQNKIYSYICNRRQLYSKHVKNHCHFICEETGKVTHFEIDSLDFLKDKIPGNITSFQLEVRGLCDDCCKGDCFCGKKRKD
ncbi:hypothetical protein HN385_04495 [archaeon]|nr:hypothetical protein [archaeon]MBT3451680.1 hypothetical protein [archaeon]MBT6869691.1 hypothetical protein [archaeon]MBT7193208.1 hypothetical protein [archaeon]MBT7380451.1 hypothetical protein [archaeon]